MQEIGEITEICSANGQEKNDSNASEDIDSGLEIVALEMGRILEKLKNNLDFLSWTECAGKSIFQELNEDIAGRGLGGELKKTTARQLNPGVPNQRSHSASAKPKDESPVRPRKRSVSDTNSKKTAKQSTTTLSAPKPNHITEMKLTKHIDNKPNYQVYKTKYQANCEKISMMHRNSQISKSGSIYDAVIRRNNTLHNSKISSESRGSANGSSHDSRTRSVAKNQHSALETSANKHKTLHADNKHYSPSTSSSSSYSNLKAPLLRPPLHISKHMIKRQSSIYGNSLIIIDPLKQLKERVEVAVRERKTFTVCGNFYTIRRALLARGWIEKIRIMYNTYDRDNLRKMQSASIAELVPYVNNPHNGYIYKRMIMSKLLGQHQVDFYWDQNFDCFRICRDNIKLTMINRFRRGIFSYTSKQGLCECMKRAHWYQQPGVAWVRHPRSYNLSNNEDPKDFISDFKITAAISLLKWIVKTKQNSNKLISQNGKVPLKIYRFAVDELLKAVKKCRHEDIDYEIEEAMEYQWNEFLEHFYKIVHIGNHFASDGKETVAGILRGATNALKKIETYWPDIKIDGMMNIWILKPTNGSRGEGIYLCRTLQYILKIIKSNTTRRYIVQKYIERPLLIYHTKFDIRQWFLISKTNPLTIWIYKDCYIRFSSQLYNLYRLHESVHLTNNSIQSRYKNSPRNAALPDCNMWDSHQFQNYLASIGHPKVWADVIYPGMKQSITAVILINQRNIDTRKNCFELYGSDFMITEDFQPWLIEINSRPALYASTHITARMCPQVLEDLIKVIIDHPKNSKASTGRFELLYKEEIHQLPQVKSETLKLMGRQLPKDYFYTPEHHLKKKQTKLLSPMVSSKRPRDDIKQISSDMKQTLETLLCLIQAERDRRKRLTHKSTNTAIAVRSANFAPLKCGSTKTVSLQTIIERIKEVDDVSNAMSSDILELSKMYISQIQNKQAIKKPADSSSSISEKERYVIDIEQNNSALEKEANINEPKSYLNIKHKRKPLQEVKLVKNNVLSKSEIGDTISEITPFRSFKATQEKLTSIDVFEKIPYTEFCTENKQKEIESEILSKIKLSNIYTNEKNQLSKTYLKHDNNLDHHLPDGSTNSQSNTNEMHGDFEPNITEKKARSKINLQSPTEDLVGSNETVSVEIIKSAIQLKTQDSDVSNVASETRNELHSHLEKELLKECLYTAKMTADKV